MASETESALLIEVPAAEPAVADLRARLDRAAAWGVPAHVTLLYPFVPPARLGPDVLAAVGEVVATVAAFNLALTAVNWFDDDVVWAAPEEPAPLRLLTARLAARFPDHPPYAGAIADPEPHLTIGHLGSQADRIAAAATVAARLPIRQQVSNASLWVGAPQPGAWRRRTTFPLARSAGEME